MSRKITHIQTVNGKVRLDQITQNSSSQNSNFPSLTTLPYEHIFQNLCQYLKPQPTVFDPKEKIELRSYSKVLSHPFSIYDNLHLDADTSRAANELSLLKNFNTVLVCDVTSNQYDQNKEALKQVSKMCSINICFGLSVDYNYQDIKKYSNELQYILLYGDNEGFFPAFLGEMFVREKFPYDSKEEEVYNMIINDIVNKHKTPLFLKLSHSLKRKNNPLIQWLKTKNITNREKIVFSVSVSDFDKFETVSEAIEEIVQEGFSVVIGLFDFDSEGKEKMDVYFNLNKAMLLNGLLVKLKKYLNLVMISNNINFKAQLKEYGGFGYANIFENYYGLLVEGLSEEERKNIFGLNLLRILDWWVEIQKEKEKAKMVKCENCGAEKEENSKDLFSKNEKIFCSFSCLKEYSKKN